MGWGTRFIRTRAWYCFAGMILQQLSDFGQSWEDYGRFNLRTDHRLNLIETPLPRHIPTYSDTALENRNIYKLLYIIVLSILSLVAEKTAWMRLSTPSFSFSAHPQPRLQVSHTVFHPPGVLPSLGWAPVVLLHPEDRPGSLRRDRGSWPSQGSLNRNRWMSPAGRLHIFY